MPIVRELIHKLHLDTKSASRNAQDFDRKVAGVATMARRATFAVVGMTTAVVGLVKSTAKTQSALGALSSLGVKDLKVLEDAATDFTNKWAGYSKAEFLEAAWDMRSALDGLSDKAVADFTSVTAITAKASKASIQEMANAVTTGYGIYRPLMKDMSDEEWVRQFAGGLTKAVGIFKASGATMSSAIKDIGAVATTAGRPLEEQLAVMGQLQRTMSGEESGVLYKNFILKAAEAGKALNLEFVDAEGRLKSVSEIITLVKKKFPDLTQAAAQVEIKKAFGSDRAYRFVTQMAQDIEVMPKHIAEIKKAMGEGMKQPLLMAEKVNQGPGEQFRLLVQQVKNLMEELGKGLTPAVMRVTRVLSSLTLGLQFLAREAPQTLKIIMALVAAFISMLVMGGLIGMVSSLASGLSVLAPAAIAAGKALMFLGKMSWLSLGLIGLIAAAIALLGWDIYKWVTGSESVMGRILGPWDQFRKKVATTLYELRIQFGMFKDALFKTKEHVLSFTSLFVRAFARMLTPYLLIISLMRRAWSSMIQGFMSSLHKYTWGLRAFSRVSRALLNPIIALFERLEAVIARARAAYERSWMGKIQKLETRLYGKDQAARPSTPSATGKSLPGQGGKERGFWQKFLSKEGYKPGIPDTQRTIAPQAMASRPSAGRNTVHMPITERITVNVPAGTTESQAKSIHAQVRDAIKKQFSRQIRFALNDMPAY